MQDFDLPPTEITEETAAADFLSTVTGLSRTRIKDTMSKGAVWLERRGSPRRLRRASAQLQAGDRVALYYREAILNTQPAPATLVNDLSCCSVWIKPRGLLCGGSRFGDHCSIDRVVARALDRPTFLVHRLDQFATGVMLLAHSKRAAAHLSDQFRRRTTTKIYRAIVHGRLASAETVTLPIDGREAISFVTPLQATDDFTEVEVQIETGRKHQVRIHLARLGHPIAGDRQQGSSADRDLQLAAVTLAFDHPETAERLTFNLPAAALPRFQEAN